MDCTVAKNLQRQNLQQFPFAARGCGAKYAKIDDVKQPHRIPTPRAGYTR